ncbi:MAG: hypothetical protein IJ727_02590 [Treponema sp.]|nr:hypothetical protein [Treponema sp.]
MQTYQDFLSELPFFEVPKNDNETLLNLQYMYLSKNDKKAQEALWLKSIAIARKLIRKEQKTKKFFLDEDILEDKSVAAVEYILRRYSKRKDNACWYVRENFISVIYNGVRHALYYQSKTERLYNMLQKGADIYEILYCGKDNGISPDGL